MMEIVLFIVVIQIKRLMPAGASEEEGGKHMGERRESEYELGSQLNVPILLCLSID